MNGAANPRPTRRGRRHADPSTSVSVLRWPAGRSAGGVFEMFSARDGGWFDVEGGAPNPAHGENVLIVRASRRSVPGAPAVLLSLVNTSPDEAVKLTIKLAGPAATSVAGTVLTAPPLPSRLDPPRLPLPASRPIAPAPFHGAVLKGKAVEITMPARSVVVLTVRQHRLVAVAAPHRERTM